MVIDTSAVVAILFDEPERGAFTDILASEATRVISVVAYYEAALVVAGRKKNPGAAQLVDDLIRDLAVGVDTPTMEDAVVAREAFFRYGRGYHPAGLNFADCFSYALAKTRGEPLLFKGNDFSETDIVAAWRP
jgi:ribonuclease VapC